MYKKCKVALCREYVKQPEVYCDKHKGNTATQYNKYVRTNPQNKSYAEFYQSSEWKRLRQYKLSINPMCEVCERNDHTKTLATIVHHVEEIRTPIGWEKRLDINNLESICQSCHNKEDHAHSFKNAGRANQK